jgi:hypothetical protein
MREQFNLSRIMNDVEPPKGFGDLLVSEINNLEVKRNKTRLIFGSIVSIASLFALLPSVIYTFSELAQSNFYNYLSLLSSDWQTVMSNWKIFMISLLESVPILPLIFTLVSILFLVVSVKVFTNTLRESKNVRFINLNII